MNKQNATKREPKHRITNPEFKYTPSDKTNVQETWRKAGWTPTTK